MTLEAVETTLREASRTSPGDESISSLLTADNPAELRLERAFRQEERAGLMLAALVRTAILLCATLYFAVSSNLTGYSYFSLVGTILGLSLLGLLQFEFLRRDIGSPWIKYVFLAVDCAYLAFMFAADLGQLETRVPPAYIIREGSILFFYVFLAQAAFSFSPRFVIWATFCIVAAWTAVLIDAITDPITIYEFWTPSQNEIGLYFQKYANPAYLPLSKWTIDVFFLTLVGLGLSVAVARSRRLVAASSAAERARANLARYFSPKLVDTLAARDAPFGQVRRQNAAVLFVDIRGFTAYAEATAPEDVIELLRAFHGRMEAEVFDAGGSLDNIMGDGLLATFGVPDASENDASRALLCARHMLKALDRWNKERAERGEHEVSVGIGLHYGPVVVGEIGSARSSAFAVIGDTVNTASRLQTLAKGLGGRLVVSGTLIEAMRQEIGPDAEHMLHGLKSEGARALKGREREVEIWVSQ